MLLIDHLKKATHYLLLSSASIKPCMTLYPIYNSAVLQPDWRGHQIFLILKFHLVLKWWPTQTLELKYTAQKIITAPCMLDLVCTDPILFGVSVWSFYIPPCTPGRPATRLTGDTKSPVGVSVHVEGFLSLYVIDRWPVKGVICFSL